MYFYVFMCRYFLIDLIDDSTQITKISQKIKEKMNKGLLSDLYKHTLGVCSFLLFHINIIYDYINGMLIQ